jgi:hypothetical protein
MLMRAFAGMILLALVSGLVFAQSADTPPAFEAADVHVSPHRTFPFVEGGVLRGDRYVLRQATMVDLIAAAYGVDASNVQGGPLWLETDRFDVIAKAPAKTPPATVKLISIFDAVDKQLGLKRERQTAPRPVLIVDSVNQKPTANQPGLEKILPSPPPPQFDVAVIKPGKPGAQFRGKINGGQVDVQGTTLKFLISFAWDLNPNDEEALVGAPKWLDADRFDILAKVVSDAPGSAGANAPQIAIEDLRQMIQALLEDNLSMNLSEKTHRNFGP